MEQKKLGALAVAGALLILGAAYLGAAQRYTQVFFPHTSLNGVAVGGMTAPEAEESLAGSVRNYVLKLNTRTGTEEIPGADIDLHAEFDGEAGRILAEQNPYLWGFAALAGKNYEISQAAAFDEEKLFAAVDGLACMDAVAMQAPEDARLSDYIEGKGYEILPEKPGTTLNREKVQAAAAEAVRTLNAELSLEAAGAYLAPQITADDPQLQEQLAQMNRYAAMTVTYVFGSQKEILEGARLQSWLSQDASGVLTVDETQAAAYVKELADRYDTAYRPHELMTSYGTAVTITKGNYGWQIDQKAETAALKEIILSGEGQEREPVYRQTAADRDGADYGNTYVEVNLTAQHLFYYVDGQLVIESDFVSGNETRSFTTPDGAYPVTYKQRNATLRGQGYASPVSYWMPFNRGIGLHDASWRGTFGGSLYKSGGSHGCINLPVNVARTIFETIEKGDPVLCYRLEGTERTATTRGADYAYVKFERGGTGQGTKTVLAAAESAKNGKKTKTAAGGGAAAAAAAPAVQTRAETSAAPEPETEAAVLPTAGGHETQAAQSADGNSGSRVVTAGKSRGEQETVQPKTSAVIEQGIGSADAGPGQTEAETVFAKPGEPAAEIQGTAAPTSPAAAPQPQETAAPASEPQTAAPDGPGAAETQAPGPANEIHINTAQP